MICQNCHQRPATVHVAQTVNGARHTMELCAHCARQLAETEAPSSLEAMLETLFGGALPNRQSAFASRLGGSAQAALNRAAEIAVSWGYDQIGVEFLLLGVAGTAPWAPPLLHGHGLSPEGLEREIAEAMGKREPLRIEQVSLTSRVKRVLELAGHEAREQGAPMIGAEHILVGLAAEGESLGAQVLARRGLDPDGLRRAYMAMSAHPEVAEAASAPAAGPGGSAAGRGFGRPDLGGAPAAPGGAGGPQLPPNLSRFSRDLSALAESGKLDPVVGREPEIERVIRILSRKTKNNPVLIGEPGVGKSAIAEGLAQRIRAGEVPDLLHGKRVLALDLGGMLAGAKYRGEFEERLKGLMDELKALSGKIVLFIDELHTVVGAGASEGAMDASNMLKPALARGELQVLGATTLDEYRKHVEKDAALERRFQPILVSEPTPDEALAILNGLRDSYEAHHRVKIEDEALKAAVDLSDRYVSDRFLPDKAIDLLDEACAMKRLGSRTPSTDFKALEEAVARLRREKEAAVAGERYDEAGQLKQRLDAKTAELEAARKSWTATQATTEPVVGPDAIARIVSEWTGIPAERLVKEEMERLLTMENDLHRRVVGQDEAVRAVAEAVRRARSGLKDPHRPIGSFLFAGPTGVGKTELARALAEHLFNDEAAMLRFDMSEYMEKHTVSRLVGAPPGYVGYEEAGQLTEAVRRKPYSVVLFDEIEKAHPDVFNLLLQVLDDGRLTDGQGRTVDFRNTIVIMTSNAGAKHLMSTAGTIGFSAAEKPEGENSWEKQREAVMEALKGAFRPEFLNRVDEIVVFKPLEKAQIASIVDKLLEETRRKLHGQAITLELTEAAKAALVEAGFDPHYGARPLKRAIQRQLETPLSTLLLKGEFEEGAHVRVDHADGQFTFFQTEEAGKAAGASA